MTAVEVIVETAYAKLNLALHVRARRDDGYHELETIFAFADAGDLVAVRSADELSLMIDGPFSEGLTGEGDNLVMRAARSLQRHFGVNRGASITLTKNLPVAAGLGGGSADAAAAARALARLWSLNTDDEALISAIGNLGADIPACMASRTVRGEGVGDSFVEIDGASFSGLPILIANPRQPLPTGPVFAAWEGMDRGALPHGDVMTAALEGRNDLQLAAESLCSEISHGLFCLSGGEELLCRMSGSGASIFALYPEASARDRAASAFAQSCPGWWTMKAVLR